jgi:hypothetical protein
MLTCDVIARNLKFYPLSLQWAVKEGKLKFVADDFMVQPCKTSEPEKLFSEMTTWELLNLRPATVLDLPTMLYDKYGITNQFLESALNDYNIQTVSRSVLEDHFSIKNPMQYFVSKTRHYSWPKGAGLSFPNTHTSYKAAQANATFPNSGCWSRLGKHGWS